MKRASDSTHVPKLIPDYVLGLLPVDEARWVDAHLAGCGQCRQALTTEQAIGRSVKVTLSKASSPDADQIRRLMPSPPLSTGALVRWPIMSPGLAAGMIALLLVFGAFALFALQQPGAWGLTAPTARSTTVLLTDTPTQTATREITVTAEGLEAIVSPSPASPAPAPNRAAMPVPALAPVPVAPILQ